MTLYLEVSNDDLELPLAVADSVMELAELRKVKSCTIYRSLAKVKRGICEKSKYIEVEVSDL